jgi:DNA (cytosine-5)-methyltransferase 1
MLASAWRGLTNTSPTSGPWKVTTSTLETGRGIASPLATTEKFARTNLPRDAKLAWASSPCTDLSLVSSRGGLHAGESNEFWRYIRLLEELGNDRPEVAVLENVVGFATRYGGEDMAAAVRAFDDLGCSVDVITVDARRFIPRPRPGLFLVAATNPPADEDELNSGLRPDWLQAVYGDPTLRTHRAPLPAPPGPLLSGLGEHVESMSATDERCWDAGRTDSFVGSSSPVQRDRIVDRRRGRGVKYRTAYRRTRNGVPVWQVRRDDISGCLRTARGGSSKQAVMKLGNKRLQVRWMTPLEYARLTGAGDYDLSGARTNQALFAFGDAVSARRLLACGNVSHAVGPR